MLSLLSRRLRWLPAACRRSYAVADMRATRRQNAVEYELSLDFSWVQKDSTGRPVPLNYLTDHTKSPDEIIAGLSDSEKQRLKDIGDQLDVQLALGKQRVPDKSRLSSFEWLHLLTCTNANSLGKKIFYLASKQWSEDSEAKRKAEKAAIRLQAKAEAGVKKSSFDNLHHRFENPELRAFYEARTALEYEFCPSLVFDMAFHDRMSTKALTDMCNQLRAVLHLNREYPEPFQLHFCNLRRDTQQFYWFHRNLTVKLDEVSKKRSLDDMYPYTFTDRCYTELFPAKDLIYMSPDAKQEIAYYDPTKVYVIGSLVDLGGQEVGVTRSKAAGQSVRSLRLPRSVCRHSLPLNQFYELLLSFRLTGSWAAAKGILPARKNLSPLRLDEGSLR